MSERASLDVGVRPAVASDADRMCEIYLASRKTLLPFAPLVHTDDGVRTWVGSVLIPSGGVKVALVEGAIAGFIAISVGDDGRGWIDQLYLDPSLVRRGIGSVLLAAGLDDLPRPVMLYAFAENAPARHFYEDAGFVAIAFGDGSGNEEGRPDVLYELA